MIDRESTSHNDESENRPSGTALPRRRAMGLVMMAGASLLASRQAHAFSLLDFLSGSPGPEALSQWNIPPEWYGRLGTQLPSYCAFLSRMNLQRITVCQIIEPHTHVRGFVQNTLPPRYMWRNIASTLRVVDQLSDRLDMPLHEMVSAYRCPAYNALLPGAKSNSYHLRNNATDLRFPCSPVRVAHMAREMRKEGIFLGGVGLYADFVHVDTRGRDADWHG